MLTFDELNILETRIEAAISADPERVKKDKDYYIDEVTDIFVMAYVFGTNEVGEELGETISPDLDEMRSVIEERFDGKNYIDRLNEYLESASYTDIKRVLETDYHRIYNAAKYTGAKKGGAVTKTWRTQLDPKVRDTHDFLEGVTVPLDAEFYTYNGNHTFYPGQFGVAEEDCGCRCWVEFSKL